jgi:hypothetical protein
MMGVARTSDEHLTAVLRTARLRRRGTEECVNLYVRTLTPAVEMASYGFAELVIISAKSKGK